MALAFEKQLVAGQKFLTGLKALPSFLEQREKQFLHLQTRLSKIRLTTEQVAKVFQVFDEDLWGDKSDFLKSAMANSNQVDAKLPRKQNQDFLALLNYIPMSLWESLEKDDRMVALEKMVNHSIKLGLQHPNEATQGLLLACVFDRDGQLMEAQRWKITEQYKATMKKFFDRAPDPPVYLLVLPNDAKEVPKLLWDRAFYPDEGPIKVPKCQALVARGRSWPMRTTHSIAASARFDGRVDSEKYLTKQDLFAFGSMMVGAVRREESRTLPGLQIFRPSAASSSASAPPAPLAIADQPANSSGQPEAADGHDSKEAEKAPKAAAVPQPADTVQASLEALRASCKNKKETKGAGKASKAKAASCKKPAAKVLKRPAAQRAVHRTVAGPAEPGGREARRQRILALVPAKLKNQFRDGCQKCYWRTFCTPSCWQMRGYGLDL